MVVGGVPFTQSVSGSVEFSVAGLVANVTDPGSGSGTISPKGKSKLASSGGTVGVAGANCKFGGSLQVFESGGVFASGGWSCTFSVAGAKGKAFGTWNASRIGP